MFKARKGDGGTYLTVIDDRLAAAIDRLAEAFAERMHERVRREFWGYAPEEGFSAEELIAEGKMSASDFPDFAAETGFRPVDHTTFIDANTFDGRSPNAYLEQFKIGLKDKETP